VTGPAVSLLAGIVVFLALPGPMRPTTDRTGAIAKAETDDGILRRLRPLICALAFAACWSFLGGLAGIAGGAAAALLSWRVLGRAEGPRARRRRRDLERDLPVAIHLFGACLSAGAATVSALETVAVAVGGAVGEEFGAVRTRLLLGADPGIVWREAGRAGALGQFGHRLARSHETGASVADVVERICEDLRTTVRTRTEARARSVEVRAAAPLGLCLLPSFLFLGVIPMTAGIFGSLSFLR
jgi:Flp pilus assembly protein TadB